MSLHCKDIFFSALPNVLTLVAAICLIQFNLSAQHFENELKEAVKSKPKLDVRLDSRNSFINQTGVRVVGFKIGFQYDNKLSFGIGYNWLWSKLKNKNINYEGNVVIGELNYRYFSPYIEYGFYSDKKWELAIPVQFGFGTSYYQIAQPDKIRLRQKTVYSYEPAITFQYRLLPYIGVGMGIGYRLMIRGNNQLDEKFTSPVYLFKMKIYFQDLYQDIKARN